ncbi:MAG: hypothetical protein R3C16_02640 [Hyphomonadaceae bacterium]
MAVISHDDAHGIYEFRAYNDGRAHTAQARFLDDGRLQWSMDFSPVLIRYTATFTNTWHEVGEMSRDGGLPDAHRRYVAHPQRMSDGALIGRKL